MAIVRSRAVPRPGGLAEGERRERGETALILAGAAGLIVGLAARQGDATVGFSPEGAFAGLVGQLPTTLPAAVVVTGAMVLNVAGGAVLVRLLRRAPFATWSDLCLEGYAGAVLLDALLLFALAGAGLFRQLALAVALVVVLAAGLRARPLVREPPRLSRPRVARWLLVGLVWSAPVILALASPVVPAADVLPNHVAPAEHLRAFGGLESLATNPSPLYGPSRLFLGYIGLMGTLVTLTGLPAALAVAQSAGWLVVLSAVSARRLASAAFGHEAAYWALLAFPLSFTFVRLPDIRDSVVALPLAALALSRMATPAPQGRTDGRPGDADRLLAIALTAAILVHPLVGAFTAGSVGLLAVADPGRSGRRVIPALAAAAIAILPQAAVMLGYAPAPAWGIVAFAAAGAAFVAVARPLDREGPPWSRIAARRVSLGLLLVGGLSLAVIGLVRPDALGQASQWVNPAFPIPFAAGLLVTLGLVPTRANGRALILAPLAVGGCALLATALVPGSSTLASSLRYEVPKAVGYWLPWACVPAAAGVFAAVARRRDSGVARAVLLGGFLGMAVLPLGSPLPDAAQASHPAADVLAHDLRTAQLGYWRGYPDARVLVDETGRRLLAFLREGAAAGKLGTQARVLHVAASYRPWMSLPIAPFTGLEETLVSADAVPDLFTDGGRLIPLSRLEAELHAGFGTVVLEPAGLPEGIRGVIAAAGYRSVFVNGAGEVFVAAGAS